jgi:hypothetical protein
MSRKSLSLAAGLVSAMAGVNAAHAAPPVPWIVSGPFSAANVTGGPWTLSQTATPAHASTLGNPRNGMCNGGSVSAHLGTDLMQPYYFPLTFGSDNKMTGYFDYRVKDNEELTAVGTTRDGGKTWQIRGTALQLNDGLCGASGLTDNGQGHAAVVEVGGTTHLYTLDRAATPSVLLEHVFDPENTNPLLGLPASEPVTGNAVPATATLVTGLTAPDGILGVVPGYHQAGADEEAVEVLYLSKPKGYFASSDPHACPSDAASKAALAQLGKKPNQDRPELHLAHTSDGISFIDDGAVVFDKINPDDPTMAFTSTRFIGPHGTVLHYKDGSYGLFFSGGNCGDGDSDAYHYIGYAHSADARHWIVDNDINSPLVSVDYSNLGTSDTMRHHYTGRCYSPSVTLNPNGKSATLIFSGYNTPQPLPATNASFGFPVANYTPVAGQAADYRALMIVTLQRGSAPKPITNDNGDDSKGHDD